MTNNTEAQVLSLLGKMGIDPAAYERKGRTWTPKGRFFPSCGSRVVFDAEKGKLFLFREREVTVVKGGAFPQAWAKSEDRPFWRNVRPRVFPPRFHLDGTELEGVIGLGPSDLSRLPGKVRAEIAWRKFIRSMLLPGDLVSVVERIHPDTGWGMLQCLTREHGLARDLCLDIPALVVLCYYNFVFHPKANTRNSFATARSLLGRRRRDILKYSGFPGDCVNILRHIPPEELSLVGLLTLRKALNRSSQARKMLLHLPPGAKITRNVFMALAHPEFLTPSLLVELGRRRTSRMFTVLKDISEMRQTLGLKERLQGFTSIRDALSAHSQLVKRCNERKMQEYYSRLIFPPPPLPDAVIDMGATAVRISALASGAAVANHARQANNCCAAYGAAVCAGRCYLYEASAEPDVGLHTISIRPDPWDHIWVLAEIEREHSKPADDVVRDAVLCYLATRQRHTRAGPEAFAAEARNGPRGGWPGPVDAIITADWYEEFDREMQRAGYA